MISKGVMVVDLTRPDRGTAKIIGVVGRADCEGRIANRWTLYYEDKDIRVEGVPESDLSLSTVEAVKRIAEGMKVLVDAGICEPFAAMTAGMSLTQLGGTPERLAMLDALEAIK